MATDHIVGLLIAERDKLNAAIAALEGTKRRGRPPKNPSAVVVAAAGPEPKRGRRTFSAAQRKAASLRMKRRWAEKKKMAKG